MWYRSPSGMLYKAYIQPNYTKARPRCKGVVGREPIRPGENQCKRKATIGMKFCYQHGGGKCYCPQNEKHSGYCGAPACHCH